MYIPRQFEETRIDVLHRLMKAHPLAALVMQGDSGLVVNHVPFLIDVADGQFGTLSRLRHLLRHPEKLAAMRANAAALARPDAAQEVLKSVLESILSPTPCRTACL